MNKKKIAPASRALCLLLFASLAFPGCQSQAPDSLRQTGIPKLVTLCRDEFNLDIVTKLAGKTLWVYVPIEKTLFKFRASEDPALPSYVDTDSRFQNNTLDISFAVKPSEGEDKGMRTAQTEESSQYFSNIFAAVYQAYADSDADIDFFVIIMADITDGVEAIYKVYKPDLIKRFSNTLMFPESSYRIVMDTRGNRDIIGDHSGKHLKPYELDLGTFLAEQIKQRIRYAELNFKEDVSRQVLEIVAYVIAVYEFFDSEWIVFKNTDAGTKTTLSRAALLERFK